MGKNLLEAYKNRLNVAESRYSSLHGGSKMSFNNKVTTATMLNNVNRILTEAFENSVPTQRADMGDYKRFCLNVTNVVFPSLIAEDLVIVKPMTSYTGSIVYSKYTYGSNKGGIKQKQLIADPWTIASRTEDNMNYSGAPVVEPIKTTSANEEVKLAWKPVEGKASLITADGTKVELDVVDGKITVPTAGEYKVAYMYDNVKIPANDLPIINVEKARIALVAKARRLAISYSQIAAFQDKTDYETDMGQQLAEKAVSELTFEINEEIINLLAETGRKAGNHVDRADFNATLPLGVSKRDHYAGFAECIEAAKVAIYNRTQKFMPSFMLCAPDVLLVLNFVEGFKASPLEGIAGPFMAGVVNGLKVFVSPSLKSGEWFVGVKGADMETAVAVYAPYMPIIPTQLLGHPDGMMEQGFSTMYALEVLNDNLIAGGTVKFEDRVVTVKDQA